MGQGPHLVLLYICTILKGTSCDGKEGVLPPAGRARSCPTQPSAVAAIDGPEASHLDGEFQPCSPV